MAFEKATFVDESVDAVDAAFSGVLPQRVFAVVGKDGRAVGVLCNHQLVIVNFP